MAIVGLLIWWQDWKMKYLFRELRWRLRRRLILKKGFVELNGIKIPICNKILSPLILDSMQNGSYERKEALELNRVIHAVDRVMEIGVGVGYISSLILKNPLVDAYIGYEANPNLLPWINRLYSINGVSGDVYNEVLANNWDSPDIDFYLRDHFWESSLLPEPRAYRETVKVSVANFNESICDFKPSLIVCDIEGGELELFRHADLKGVQKIYMEVHQGVLGRDGMLELFNIMAEKGFHYDEHHSSGAVVLFSHIDR